jgi:hypothetical protein
MLIHQLALVGFGLCCVRSSCTVSVYILSKDCSQGTVTFASSFGDGFYTKLDKPDSLCCVHIVNWGGNIHKEWSKQSPQPTWMGTGEFWCYSSFQQKLNINVRDRVYVIVIHFDGIQYSDLLERTVPLLLEAVPFSICEGIWFQHDRSPPFFSCKVRNWLNNPFSRHVDQLWGSDHLVSMFSYCEGT